MDLQGCAAGSYGNGLTGQISQSAACLVHATLFYLSFGVPMLPIVSLLFPASSSSSLPTNHVFFLDFLFLFIVFSCCSSFYLSLMSYFLFPFQSCVSGTYQGSTGQSVCFVRKTIFCFHDWFSFGLFCIVIRFLFSKFAECGGSTPFPAVYWCVHLMSMLTSTLWAWR